MGKRKGKNFKEFERLYRNYSKKNGKLKRKKRIPRFIVNHKNLRRNYNIGVKYWSLLPGFPFRKRV